MCLASNCTDDHGFPSFFLLFCLLHLVCNFPRVSYDSHCVVLLFWSAPSISSIYFPAKLKLSIFSFLNRCPKNCNCFLLTTIKSSLLVSILSNILSFVTPSVYDTLETLLQNRISAASSLFSTVFQTIHASQPYQYNITSLVYVFMIFSTIYQYIFLFFLSNTFLASTILLISLSHHASVDTQLPKFNFFHLVYSSVSNIQIPYRLCPLSLTDITFFFFQIFFTELVHFFFFFFQTYYFLWSRIQYLIIDKAYIMWC